MFRYLLRRLLALMLLPLAFVLMNMQLAQAEGAQPYVNVSVASCVNGTGQVNVTLYPGASATQDVQFIIMVDNQSFGDGVYIPVAPGTTTTIPVTPLEDGTHRFEIIADDVTIFDQTREVSCAAVPTGPYTNPKGLLWDQCSGQVGVKISNYPIANDFSDLQSVTFVVQFVSNVYPGIKQLASVTLPAGKDDSFDSTFSVTPGSPGVVTLYANGVAVQHLDFNGACVVVPVTSHHKPKHKKHHHKKHHAPVGSALPNTGK